MNAGTNHILHVGHGYKYNMSVGDGSILNYDATSLTNGQKLFSMYLMNCTNVAFDTDCLAEYFLLNPNGGAFAVTGSSRSAFPSASRPYLDDYYSAPLRRATSFSSASSRRSPASRYTPSAYGETADRWTHFIYNYLGDPEICIFQGSGEDLRGHEARDGRVRLERHPDQRDERRRRPPIRRSSASTRRGMTTRTRRPTRPETSPSPIFSARAPARSTSP